MCWFCWVCFRFVDEENCVGFIKLRLYISQQGKHTFLGGLSLHLNHLIASRMGICYRQFGTLPIGFFLSNLD